MRSTIHNTNGFEYFAEIRQPDAPANTYSLQFISRWDQAKDPSGERRLLQLNLARDGVQQLRALLDEALLDIAPKGPLLTIYEGELSDAPGRSESWTEYLRPYSSGRWVLEINGTDFAGLGPTEGIVERFASTTAMVRFMAERDAENSPGDAIGPRLSVIEDYARGAGRVDVLKLIHRVRAGVRERNPRILRVTGTISVGPYPRGAEPRRTFLKLETDKGRAIMAVPEPSSTKVTCWRGDNPYTQNRWVARMTPRLREAVRPLLEGNEVDKADSDTRGGS